MNFIRITTLQSRETAMHILHSVRLVASFALLGAVIAGIAAGWMTWPFDVRIIGLFVGAVFALAARATRVL